MRNNYLIFLVAFISTTAMAQEVRIAPAEDTTRAKELEEVVVTGQYKPQSLKNSVYQIKVINKDRILKQGATRLRGCTEE